MPARQQRAHAAHQQAVLRDQRDWRVVGAQLRQHLSRSALRFGLEIGADRDVQVSVTNSCSEGLGQLHIGVDRKAWRFDVGAVEQAFDQRIRSA